MTRRRGLVIGYGNPLRADDGIGWHAATALSTALSTHPALADIDVLPRHQLTPELAEDVAAATRVVFIDACLGCEPGQICVRPVHPGPRPGWSHHLRPEGLVGLASTLYDAAPPVWLVTVVGARFGHDDQLSPLVRACLPRIVGVVRRLFERQAAALGFDGSG